MLLQLGGSEGILRFSNLRATYLHRIASNPSLSGQTSYRYSKALECETLHFARRTELHLPTLHCLVPTNFLYPERPGHARRTTVGATAIPGCRRHPAKSATTISASAEPTS